MIKPFFITSRVYYQDTDAGGVVYHSKYLDFCERARTEFLREKGIEQNELSKNEDIIFAVRNLKIDYIAPAKLDDLLQITAEIQEIKGLRIKMKQKISNQIDDKLLSVVELELVSLDKNLKPKRLSDKIKKLLK